MRVPRCMSPSTGPTRRLRAPRSKRPRRSDYPGMSAARSAVKKTQFAARRRRRNEARASIGLERPTEEKCCCDGGRGHLHDQPSEEEVRFHRRARVMRYGRNAPGFRWSSTPSGSEGPSLFTSCAHLWDNRDGHSARARRCDHESTGGHLAAARRGTAEELRACKRQTARQRHPHTGYVSTTHSAFDEGRSRCDPATHPEGGWACGATPSTWIKRKLFVQVLPRLDRRATRSSWARTAFGSRQARLDRVFARCGTRHQTNSALAFIRSRRPRRFEQCDLMDRV